MSQLKNLRNKYEFIQYLELKEYITDAEAAALFEKTVMADSETDFLNTPVNELRTELKSITSKLTAANPDLPPALKKDLESVAEDFENLGYWDSNAYVCKKLGLDPSKLEGEITKEDYNWLESRFGSKVRAVERLSLDFASDLKRMYGQINEEAIRHKFDAVSAISKQIGEEREQFKAKLRQQGEVVSQRMEEVIDDLQNFETLTTEEELKKRPEWRAQIEDEIKNHEWFNVFDDLEKLESVKSPTITFTDAEERETIEKELARRGLPDLLNRLENPPQ